MRNIDNGIYYKENNYKKPFIYKNRFINNKNKKLKQNNDKRRLFH